MDLPQPIEARLATEDDRATLERLWTIFRHDMSTYTRSLPNADGTYRSERLEQSLTDASWDAWIVTAGVHPIGFCLTRAMDEPVHVVNSFFIVAPARRAGLGNAFLRVVVRATPGTWTVAYQDDNTAAAWFWTAAAAAFDNNWRLDHRPVPGDARRSPDVWATFRVEPQEPRSTSRDRRTS